MSCKHLNFQADVNVYRLTEPNTGEVSAYSACVKIRCTDCGQAFSFLGMNAGLDPDRPTVSFSRDEARLPIVSYGDPNQHSPAARWRRTAAYQGVYDPTEPASEADCACQNSDRWFCWAARYGGDEDAIAVEEIRAEGGPCACACHDEGEDEE